MRGETVLFEAEGIFIEFAQMIYTIMGWKLEEGKVSVVNEVISLERDEVECAVNCIVKKMSHLDFAKILKYFAVFFI